MQTLGEVIDRNAAWHPDRLAVRWNGVDVSHSGFAVQAARLASGLHRLGMRRQDRIALFSMNRLEYLEAYAACELAGYIASPINFRLAAPEVLHAIRDATPKVLIFDVHGTRIIDALRSQLPPDLTLIALDGAEGPDMTFDDVVASGENGGPPYRASAQDYVHLMYTSGTTGRPKGAVRTQAAALATATAIAIDFGLDGDERTLINTPLFHVGAKDTQMAASWRGAAVVLHESFTPAAVLAAMDRDRITSTFMVPAMLQAVLDAPEFDDTDLSSVRTIMSAAAPIPVPLLERAVERFGPVFTVLYGMTESGGNTVLPRHEVVPGTTADERRRLASVGHPGFGTAIRIVDDAGIDVPPDTAGEILMKSPAQFSGYWNNTAATIEAVRDGWLHTGDIGVRDSHGYLYIVDRKKDMIISGGENVYSREVEDAIEAHPDVAEVAVIGVPHVKWGETVKAVVVLRNPSSLDEASLVEHCRSRIARYKCPTSVAFVEDLPRGATGKVDKADLRRGHAR